MTTIAELSLSTDEFALAETVQQLPALEVRVESVVAEGPVRTVPLVWFSNVDRTELEATLETDPTVDEYRRLLADTEAGDLFYRLTYTEAVASVCRCVYTHGAQYSTRRYRTAGGRFDCSFPIVRNSRPPSRTSRNGASASTSGAWSRPARTRPSRRRPR